MQTYFARHSGKLALSDASLARLRAEGRFAIHFPWIATGKDEDPDTTELDPELYSDGKKQMRCLVEISTHGGYVCAAYRDTRTLTIGRVEPGTPIDLIHDVWSDESGYSGRVAILKSLVFSSAKVAPPALQALLLSARPRMGTLSRWTNIGDKVERWFNGTPGTPSFSALYPSYQEVLCAEFLRTHDLPEVPRLANLLLPVGRTMQDIDILGVAEDGRTLRAQVTHGNDRDKLARLARFGEEGDDHLIYFCDAVEVRREGRVLIVSVSLAFDQFTSTAAGAQWLSRIDSLL